MARRAEPAVDAVEGAVLSVNDLRELVRRRMRAVGWDRSWLARNADVSTSTVQRFLAGQRIRPLQMQGILAALGVELGAQLESWRVDSVRDVEQAAAEAHERFATRLRALAPHLFGDA